MIKSRLFTILSPFLLIGVFILVGVACSETEPERVDDGGGSTDDVSASENDDSSGDDGELEEAEGFVVGDTVRMGELVMTLHGVRWDEGDEFTGPDEGMRWLVADIEVTNESDESEALSSLVMFDLIDEENRSRDLAVMADTEGSLDGELGAGRSLRGDIAWEVREEHTAWELIFEPGFFGFGQAIFDVTTDDL